MAREGWEIVKLRSITEFINRGLSPKYSDDGFLVVNQKCVREWKVNLEQARYHNNWKDLSYNKKIIQWDILINSTGKWTLGRVGLVNFDVTNLTCDSHVAIIRPDITKWVDSKYIWYSLIKREALIESLGKWSTNQTELSKEDIENLEISLPPIHEQQRIAWILSVYDDLIENNTRRITLLEHMAQALYREWFVEYKFPWYQEVEMVESETDFGMIPSGWEVKVNLKDLISINKGISYKWSELSDTKGIHFVNLKCFIRWGGFRNDGIKKYTWLYKYEKILKPWDLVMAVTDMTQAREIVARVAMVPDLDWDITMSCDVVKIVPENIDKTYLYYMLRFSWFSDTIKEMANWANVLHLRPDSIYEYPIIIPSQIIIELFKKQCSVIIDEMWSLEKQNQSLKEQRDLLLRKLIG